MQRIRPKSLHAVTGKPTSEGSEEEQAVLGCRGKKSGNKGPCQGRKREDETVQHGRASSSTPSLSK